MFFVLIFTLCFFFSMSGIFSAVSKYIWYMFWIRWAIYQLLFGQRNHYGCFSVSQINFAGLIYALQGSMFWKFPSLVNVRFTHTHTHASNKIIQFRCDWRLVSIITAFDQIMLNARILWLMLREWVKKEGRKSWSLIQQ